MTGVVTVACAQLNARPEIDQTLTSARNLAAQAKDRGANFITFPENAVALRVGKRRILELALPEAAHPGLDGYRNIAVSVGVPILVGSIPIRTGDGDNARAVSRCFVLGGDGTILGRYDKIHMFDVDLPDGESYRESATYQAGTSAALVDMPWGKLGLSICYDVRFPYLYRRLAKAGATMITVPAAFTRQTGAAHWEVLLRSRAIETGAFIVAPAQTGEHDGGRTTYGHSMIVDPWGTVLADGGTDPGLIVQELDLSMVDRVRAAIPAPLQSDAVLDG